MLDYDFVFKKGILFIELKGDVTKETSFLFKDEITPLILDNGIKNVIINVSNLKNIDDYGINALYDSCLILNKESDIKISEIPYYLRSKFKHLLKYIKESEDDYTLLTRN